MEKVKAEYLWIDGDGNVRGKTKILDESLSESVHNSNVPHSVLPEWNYDGSSTGQADGNDSEVIIKPCAVFKDPFRKEHDILVLCDTYYPDGKPHITNTRVRANDIFEKTKDLKPMFGIEQEFFLTKCGYPVGLQNVNGGRLPSEQGDYYCGSGENAVGRNCIEHAFDNCINAGLSLTGLNAEVAPSQWEFQVCDHGINVADQLYIMRYILNRTAEQYGWSVNFHPKPVSGDWNGSGCHTNFSTEPMRKEGGYDIILNAIDKLSKRHEYHMERYGKDNDKRMTGKHETAKYTEFSYGVANRGASVRIPRQTEKNGYGYFEDRRPSSNMDPYVVTSLIVETVTA